MTEPALPVGQAARSIVCRAKQRPKILLDSPVAYVDVSSNLAHRQMTIFSEASRSA